MRGVRGVRGVRVSARMCTRRSVQLAPRRLQVRLSFADQKQQNWALNAEVQLAGSDGRREK